MPAEMAVNDRPGHHEHRFHVEQDEEDGDQVKADAEAAAGVAGGHDAALIGGELGFGVAMAAHKPGGNHHAHSQAQLQQQFA